MGNNITKTKNMLAEKMPRLVEIYYRLCYRKQRSISRTKTVEELFTGIYKKGGWGESESVSGPGSRLEDVTVLIQQLPILFKEWKVRTMLDIPCGDFNWMKDIPLDLDLYIGADIVDDLIDKVNKKFGINEKREFLKLDLTRDELPRVDLIFCRDCLVHLSYREIINAINNIKRSKSKYLLTTTYPICKKNIDIVCGEWRPINLTLPPFNFPPEADIIDERRPDKKRFIPKKSMGLWLIESLPTV